LVRVFSWFRSETKFKNFDGSLQESFRPMYTPLYDHFWDKTQYSPEWLFYVELLIAAALLYVVIVIRPTRLSRGKNKYKGTVSKGQEKRAAYNRARAAAQRGR
jgi:hypothetical protein